MQEKLITLTPNNRLARHLQKRFCEDFIEENQNAWHSPIVLPIKTWLSNCWLESKDPRILLTTHQERLLWQKIITEILGERFISLTNIAMNAYNLVNSYLLQDVEKFPYETEDITIFKQINFEFHEACKKKSFVTISQLPSLLIPYIHNYTFKNIILAGFDEYTPQLQQLIEHIKEKGCKVSEYDPNTYTESTKRKIAFNTLKQEITNSSNWAKQLIDKNNKISIGIVAPNLVNLRSQIDQIFSDTIDKKSINISTGMPLTSIPIINSALNILALKKPLKTENIKELLLSPYIYGSNNERSHRSILESKMQILGRTTAISYIRQLAEENKIEIPILLNKLEEWDNIPSDIRHNHCPSKYPELFIKILQCFGWPGENNLSDIESNSVKQFIDLIHSITSSKLIFDKISYKKAFQVLHDLITKSTLQPEGETDSQINIIGSLEAAGLNFDHLWVMGLDQETWPPASHPNPFIPIETQKKFSLPHSSAQREFQFCKTLIERYKRSAKEVIFSYVKQSEDHNVEPSQLIADILEHPSNNLNLTPKITTIQKIYRSKNLESLIDITAPKMNSSEKIYLSSRIIELQSVCPFQAFVEFRLTTKQSQIIEPGISKIQRGIVIHEILENFWQEIKTQQKLLDMEQTKLQELIKKTIKISLDKLKIQENLYELEEQCLISSVSKWIELEKTRPAFQVYETEKNINTKISSLPIKLRIDRIDKTTNNNTILIDYKTGKHIPTVFDWFSDRPKNIQLLLYAIAIRSINEIAIAQINRESIKLKQINLKSIKFALEKNDPTNPMLKEDITWKDIINYWQNILNKLANDFISGNSEPNPISPQTCKSCSFSYICRASQA